MYESTYLALLNGLEPSSGYNARKERANCLTFMFSRLFAQDVAVCEPVHEILGLRAEPPSLQFGLRDFNNFMISAVKSWSKLSSTPSGYREVKISSAWVCTACTTRNSVQSDIMKHVAEGPLVSHEVVAEAVIAIKMLLSSLNTILVEWEAITLI